MLHTSSVVSNNEYWILGDFDFTDFRRWVLASFEVIPIRLEESHEGNESSSMPVYYVGSVFAMVCVDNEFSKNRRPTVNSTKSK